MHVQSGHFGAIKNVKCIQGFCVFKDMHKVVAKVIGECSLCAQTKLSNSKCQGFNATSEKSTVHLFALHTLW